MTKNTLCNALVKGFITQLSYFNKMGVEPWTLYPKTIMYKWNPGKMQW